VIKYNTHGFFGDASSFTHPMFQSSFSETFLAPVKIREKHLKIRNSIFSDYIRMLLSGGTLSEQLKLWLRRGFCRLVYPARCILPRQILGLPHGRYFWALFDLFCLVDAYLREVNERADPLIKTHYINSGRKIGARLVK
jgi:hypothetical protein